MKKISLPSIALTIFSFSAGSALAWDYEGHRAVNQLALASLPSDFPAFVKAEAAAERVAFLAGEPDRWRNTPDLALKHFNGPDHYMDIEQLALFGLKPESLPVFRYDFVGELNVVYRAHPDSFGSLESGPDEDHTRHLVGLLPWAVTEHYGKLKSGFSYLKAFEEDGGTADEIANAQQNIIYVMGVMGHFVGDASQPLHTTIHHHGWVGENPNRYTTNQSFHSWIDGGYFGKIGGINLKELQSKLRPAHAAVYKDRPAKAQEMFRVIMDFLLEQHKLVEPLYQLEKEGKLSGGGEVGLQGRAFLEGQLVKSGQMLGDIWYSAWSQATPDSYLKSQLAKRKRAAGSNAEKK